MWAVVLFALSAFVPFPRHFQGFSFHFQQVNDISACFPFHLVWRLSLWCDAVLSCQSAATAPQTGAYEQQKSLPGFWLGVQGQGASGLVCTASLSWFTDGTSSLCPSWGDQGVSGGLFPIHEGFAL